MDKPKQFLCLRKGGPLTLVKIDDHQTPLLICLCLLLNDIQSPVECSSNNPVYKESFKLKHSKSLQSFALSTW